MTDEFDEEQFEEKPFLEHLEDLRMTLFKIIVVTIAGALICLAVSKQIFSVLRGPISRYARIVSSRHLTQPAQKSPSPRGSQGEEPKPSGDRSQPGTRVIVTGPLGGVLMLARDLVIYSKEALSLLSRYADKPDAPRTTASQKKSAKTPESLPQDEKERKRSSREKKEPLPAVTIIETGPTKGFIVVIKTSFICAVAVTLPLSLFFLAQFVFPALTRKEKKHITPSFFIGGVLFLIGLLFGYFITLPLALRIFVQLNQKYGIENVWKLSEYLGTVTKLLIANGVIFEMPLLLTLLVRIGVLSVATLRKKRRHAIVIMLFVAAGLSPPDPPTMFMIAAPMIVMYEVCIWVSTLLMRKKRRREEEEEESESYWTERKKIRSAEKVEPEEGEEKESPDHDDYGSPDDEYSENYWHEDQGGMEGPPDESEPEPDDDSPPHKDYGEGYLGEDQSGTEERLDESEPEQGDAESDSSPPDEHKPDEDEDNPEHWDD
ncbi:twin-arginine translocase subunit TatC [bacterium]|nr:twin-arginine translocase subunit TatC [bacterium]